MEKSPLPWRSIILGTAIALNGMLLGLLMAHQEIIMPQSAVPTATSLSSQSTEVQSEWIGSTTLGKWQIEHYQQFEGLLNEEGEIIEKKALPEQTHLRYWKGE